MKSLSELVLSVAVFLEREAGHNLLSAALVIAGISMLDPAQRQVPSRDLIVFGLGVLARSMGSPNNK
jgi:hypothetical protein